VASLHDGNAKNRALIVESIESLYYPKVSPNGLWLFYASNTKEISNLHLLALPDGKPYTLVESLRKVFPREGDGLFEHAYNILCPSFSADSKSLILGIQAKPMRSHGESFLLGPFVITRLDMSSGVVSTLGEVSRNTSSFSYSPDGDIFYVYEEFKGFSEVRLNESSH
jgi:Tol biopolymer transport system component